MSEYAIPKIIHSVWVGGGEKSNIAKESIASWFRFCPDYTLMEWNEGNFDIESSCSYVGQAFSKKKWAFVSDYIRLRVLYEYGGIYCDTDLEILKNIDDFLHHKGFFCAESHYSVSTAIIAAQPHAAWIKELLNEYENLSFINSDGSMNTITNTKRVQKYLEAKYSYHWKNEPQELEDGLLIYPEEYFSPLNCYTGKLKITDKTCAIHHYDNTWMSTSQKTMKRIKQFVTCMIGEDNRAKLARLKQKGSLHDYDA